MSIMTTIQVMFMVCVTHVYVHAAVSIRCVPTFENASVYIEGTQAAPADLRIEYKESSAQAWLRGHQLSNSRNDAVPRTSIMGIKAATTYSVRCLDKLGNELATTNFSTWSDTVPIAKTVKLSELEKVDGAYLLTESGSAEAWIKYVADAGEIIEGGNVAKQAIRIEGISYIVIENMKIVGGHRHGIAIEKAHHIRIRNCDISGFGRVGKQDLEKDGKYYTEDGKAINYDAGVAILASSQIVVENCFIHDPRNHANSWFYSHPAGPNGIFIRAKGQVVVRYNDFIGSQKHRWNDVIEGYGNGKVDGGFTQDSDIYGNYLAFCNDDGIELDGGQCNVRFYENKIEGGLCGISTAPNMRGPSFVYRNVVVNLGDERGATGSAVKNGGGSTHAIGKTFFYYNTFFTRGNGIASVGFGGAKNRSMFLGFSRNNLLCVSGPGVRNQFGDPQSDFDYDYLSTPTGKAGSVNSSRPIEAHAKRGPAGFVNSEEGNFALLADSAAQSGTIAVDGVASLPRFGANPEEAINQMIPLRPIQATVDRQQLRFRIAKDALTLPRQTVQLRNTGSVPLTFRIDKNTAFNWFDVNATEMTVAAQSTVDIVVAINESISAESGLLPGAFLINFTGGLRLPVTLYVDVLETDYVQMFQVEDIKGAEHFQKVEDAAALGGVCLDFVKGETELPEGGSVEHAVHLEIEVPAAGTYNVYYRLKCPDPIPLHDSLFLKLNKEEKRKCAVGGSSNWTWSRTRAVCNFNKGSNVLVLSPREQLFIDAVYISTRAMMAGESIE